ncbi:MAG: hypothetical protein HPKKFMNG_00683 [Planctomycetes bacterium]|nr:hypothetical protein [Planctomycetota bacterium]HRJ76927.1 choice-of-anchor D domain-containing protein [Planctomycetota bacterium]
MTRFRLTLAFTLGALCAAGLAAQDYGDAPSPYPTCAHWDQSQGTRIDAIGFSVSDDGYLASQVVAGGFTADEGDDGVEFLNFIKGSTAQIKVAVICTQNTNDLAVWMDFNNDGQWDAGERVIWAGYSSAAPNGAFAARVATPGSSNTSFNTYNVNIPAGAVGTHCRVRVRLWDTASHTSGAMAANGGGSPSLASDYGECEDNEVPYGSSTGAKADVKVYDPNLMVLTAPVPSGGNDNRGNLTVGQQATLYYGVSCLNTASYALRFPSAPTLSISPISNCSVVEYIVPATGYSGIPGGGYFTVIFGLTPTTAGSPFSATVSMNTNQPVSPVYSWTISGNAVPPAPSLSLQRPAYTPIANGSTDNIGTMSTGSGQAFTWYIFNNGAATLNLTGSPLVALSAFNNCSATLTAAPASSLPGGGYSTSFTLQIVPAAVGFFSFQASIASNDTSANPYSVTIAGSGGSSGGTPSMNVQRPTGTTISNGATDSLGALSLGAGSSFSYVIGNAGTGTLVLTGSPLVALSNLSGCSVSVTSQPASSVAAGGQTSFVVLVTPSAASFSFRITIANSDAANNPYIVNVTGTAAATAAPEIDVSRGASPVTSGGSDALGQVALGGPTSFSWTVANLGTAALTISGLSLGGQSNCTATIGTSPSSTIAAGSTTSFSVNVTPTGASAFSFSVSISNNDSNENPYTFQVSGTGVVNGPEIEVQRPAGISLASGSTDNQGTVAFGVNLQLTYIVANLGNQALNLTGTPAVALSNISNCSVAVTSAPGSAIPASSNTSFTINYSVAGVGAFGFRMTLVSNDVDEPAYIINVSGTGGTLPDISVRLQSAQLADGGQAAAGSLNINSPVRLTFTITNAGNAPLNLTGPAPVAAGGTMNCSAVVAQPAQLTLAAGASTTFGVDVTATSLNSFSFSISISSDDPDENPFNFTVQGVGSTFTIGDGNGGGGGGCSADAAGSTAWLWLPLALVAAWSLRRRRMA